MNTGVVPIDLPADGRVHPVAVIGIGRIVKTYIDGQLVAEEKA